MPKNVSSAVPHATRETDLGEFHCRSEVKRILAYVMTFKKMLGTLLTAAVTLTYASEILERRQGQRYELVGTSCRRHGIFHIFFWTVEIRIVTEVRTAQFTVCLE